MDMGKSIAFLCRLLLVVALLCGATASAQSQKPRWLNDGLHDLTYSYVEVVTGEASSVAEAQDNAALAIVQQRNLAAGANVKVHVENGKITTTGDQKMVVAARIIDKYVEELGYGGYRVYLLVQTLKRLNFDFDKVSVTSDYPFSARCLVPGMQQLYKGQKVKGIAFIGAEVLAVGGIIVSESMRADYSGKAAVERNASRKTALVDNANTMQNVRNICIGAAAAVYIWNVVDAIVSKGGKRVVLADATLTPYATTDGFGLAFNYRF